MRANAHCVGSRAASVSVILILQQGGCDPFDRNTDPDGKAGKFFGRQDPCEFVLQIRIGQVFGHLQ